MGENETKAKNQKRKRKSSWESHWTKSVWWTTCSHVWTCSPLMYIRCLPIIIGTGVAMIAICISFFSCFFSCARRYIHRTDVKRCESSVQMLDMHHARGRTVWGGKGGGGMSVCHTTPSHVLGSMPHDTNNHICACRRDMFSAHTRSYEQTHRRTHARYFHWVDKSD